MTLVGKLVKKPQNKKQKMDERVDKFLDYFPKKIDQLLIYINVIPERFQNSGSVGH